MKLLFDQNLSPTLVEQLTDIFPGSLHTMRLNLGTASDADVWKYARENGFVLVSKDSDFIDLSVLDPNPAKLICLRLGNCSTQTVAAALRALRPGMDDFQVQRTIFVYPGISLGTS